MEQKSGFTGKYGGKEGHTEGGRLDAGDEVALSLSSGSLISGSVGLASSVSFACNDTDDAFCVSIRLSRGNQNINSNRCLKNSCEKRERCLVYISS